MKEFDQRNGHISSTLHTIYVSSYDLCTFIRSMYLHTIYVPSYDLCTFIRSMYLHTIYVSSYDLCIFIRSMYLLILTDTLLLGPSLHFTTLVDTSRFPI